MIGPYLNALGILLGALFGLALRLPLTAQIQAFFKSALGLLAVVYGVRLIYNNVSGGLWADMKELAVAFLAVVLGYWLGKLARLQSLSNRLGHHAATLLATAEKNPPAPPVNGFVAATLLFCAAPLGFLGAVADGLQNYFYLLLLKAAMDGLAMMSFVKMFRWPVALAALPVFFFFNGLSWLAHLAAPWLELHGLAASVGVTAGLLSCIVSVVIFQVRRVELANYLPALALAPLLTLWWA